ncbi:MAG: sulfurtransferase TusA family protein [Acidimicrobiia bacterium]
MTVQMEADKVLDCTDLLCPIPVIKTSQAIKEIEVGQILHMIATDPGAPPDMEAWSRQTGHELVDNTEEDGKYLFWFKRTR